MASREIQYALNGLGLIAQRKTLHRLDNKLAGFRFVKVAEKTCSTNSWRVYERVQQKACPEQNRGIELTDIFRNADEWLRMQTALLLPVKYFMVTATLPDTLNAVARRNQKFIYGIFFQTAAATLQKLAADPKFVGGQLGFFGVLQTLRA
ncbi:MAG: hypothetical protein ACRENG_24345 [bacterium]